MSNQSVISESRLWSGSRPWLMPYHSGWRRSLGIRESYPRICVKTAGDKFFEVMEDKGLRLAVANSCLDPVVVDLTGKAEVRDTAGELVRSFKGPELGYDYLLNLVVRGGELCFRSETVLPFSEIRAALDAGRAVIEVGTDMTGLQGLTGLVFRRVDFVLEHVIVVDNIPQDYPVEKLSSIEVLPVSRCILIAGCSRCIWIDCQFRMRIRIDARYAQYKPSADEIIWIEPPVPPTPVPGGGSGGGWGGGGGPGGGGSGSGDGSFPGDPVPVPPVPDKTWTWRNNLTAYVFHCCSNCLIHGGCCSIDLRVRASNTSAGLTAAMVSGGNLVCFPVLPLPGADCSWKTFRVNCNAITEVSAADSEKVYTAQSHFAAFQNSGMTDTSSVTGSGLARAVCGGQSKAWATSHYHESVQCPRDPQSCAYTPEATAEGRYTETDQSYII